MQDLADRLPTLDEAAPPPQDTPDADAKGFAPDAILKALRSGREGAAQKTGARARPHRAGSEQFAATLRKAAVMPAPKPSAESPQQATGFERALPTFGEKPEAKAPDRTLELALEEAAKTAAKERDRALASARAEWEKSAAAKLCEERERWAGELARDLDDKVSAAFGTLHTRIADALSGALLPVLEEDLRRRCVAQFADALQRLAKRSGTDAPINVSGPQPLLDALIARRGGTESISLAPGDDIELTATLSETTLRSNLAASIESLRAAIGHDT